MPDDDLLKALFGRAIRVSLALWIVDHDPAVFTQKEAIEANGGYGHATAVREELLKLAGWGVLQQAPTTDRGNAWQRLDHPLWRIFRAAAQAFEELDARNATR